MNVRCQTCGLTVQVPAGGRRLCGCGTWLSADEPIPVVEPIEEDVPEVELAPLASRKTSAPPAPAARAAIPATTESWPRIEGDLSAIERLNDGYRRIASELGKTIVGQERVHRGTAHRHLRPRPLPAGRRARPGQDA